MIEPSPFKELQGAADASRRGDVSTLRSSDKASWLSRVLLISLGIVLVGLVTNHTFAAYLADAAPRAALLIAPNEPAALLNVAEDELARALAAAAEKAAGERAAALPERGSAEATTTSPVPVDPKGIDSVVLNEVARMAENAHRQAPMSASALRLIGQVARYKGDAQRSQELMSAAARRSMHENAAVFSMIEQDLKARRWEDAVMYTDILLRTQLELVPVFTPTLAQLAEHPEAAPFLKRRLAANPGWRQAFLDNLPGQTSDPKTPLDLLLSFKETPYPPAKNDYLRYIRFLISHEQYELAYFAWLQLLPARHLAVAASLFNGGFELPLSDMPFDWSIGRSTGATVTVETVPSEPTNLALKIDLIAGRVQLGEVTQRTLLAPGQYRLTGNVRGELTGRRGLKWTIACATTRDRKQLAETAAFFGNQPKWLPFQQVFTVPDRDCAMQIVTLVLDARHASEQFVTGKIWYDDLRISKSDVP